MTRTTLPKINKALAARFGDGAVEIVHGDGYFYFLLAAGDDREIPSIYVCWVYELSLTDVLDHCAAVLS